MQTNILLCFSLLLTCIYGALSWNIQRDSQSEKVKEKALVIRNETINGTDIFGSVSAENDITYIYTYNYSSIQQWAIYVCVQSVNATEGAPLLVVVRQSLSVMSWVVPLKLSDGSYKHAEVCHTLCPLRNYMDTKVAEGPQHVHVEFTTSSSLPLLFKLNLKKVDDFLIGTNNRQMFNITPSRPQVLEYHMPPGIKSVLIEAKSHEKECMILAIQDIQCPFYDSERTVEYKGFYQTMTLQSGITVTRKSFKEGEVYIVMILKPTDDECTEPLHSVVYPDKSRSKTVEVNIVPSVSEGDFYTAIFGALAFFLLLYLFSFFICCFLFVRRRRSLIVRNEIQTIGTVVQPPCVQNYGAVSGSALLHLAGSYKASSDESDVSTSGNNVYAIPTPPNQRERRQSQGSIDEADFDKLPDVEVDKNVIRTKTILYVADLARKRTKDLSERTKVYSWNLVTVAVFYGLPVIQLVYINQKIVNYTGNQDLCYYNFLCSHKSWVFSDFNHVYSNLGYVMLGVLFLLLVWRREMFDSDLRADARRDGAAVRELPGIPHHFGLFYAMGWALIMEGILSASYHVCPNKANFQFDTAFMYVIATVCMLKLYQGRHPDITAKSHQTWMMLSVVLLVGVAGVLQGGTLFWIAFVMGHLTITFLVGTTIYYMGRWSLDRWIFKRIFQNLRLDFAAGSFRPTYLGRFLMLTFAAFLNVAMDLFGIITRPVNFGAFLLAVFIMNLIMYLMYYTIMKLRCSERIRWIPFMYMVLSFSCWIAALYFFLAKNTSWQMTPAGSRERNKPCRILNFYDDHDIWHFVSSCALFFSYMVLFTLDDDLENTPREAIMVF